MKDFLVNCNILLIIILGAHQNWGAYPHDGYRLLESAYNYSFVLKPVVIKY